MCCTNCIPASQYQSIPPESHVGQLPQLTKPALILPPRHSDRVIVAIVGALPQLADRVPLWVKDQRDDAFGVVVTLTPTGAVKTIGHFGAFRGAHGVTQHDIMTAYKAAADARKQQLAIGQKPFLVSASKGPILSSQKLQVHTQPLGYQRSISTEEVRWCVRFCDAGRCAAATA